MGYFLRALHSGLENQKNHLKKVLKCQVYNTIPQTNFINLNGLFILLILTMMWNLISYNSTLIFDEVWKNIITWGL